MPHTQCPGTYVVIHSWDGDPGSRVVFRSGFFDDFLFRLWRFGTHGRVSEQGAPKGRLCGHAGVTHYHCVQVVLEESTMLGFHRPGHARMPT